MTDLAFYRKLLCDRFKESGKYMQTSIPFLFMRGGSSRGPFFQRRDLPGRRGDLNKVLIAALGSGHPLNIDGIGGGNAVTTKVAILSQSSDPDVDIDYLFAQVSVLDRLVDYKPTCGNMLAAVGPAAIEMGLIPTDGATTTIRVRAVNTDAHILAKVHTGNGQVIYDGNALIDGVPGTAAPIEMQFLNVAGSSTGSFLPTGQTVDNIDGIEVTCMDVAMPMVIARASDFGLVGDETQDELDNSSVFFERMEKVRLEAAKKMGMGDCRESVTPKFGLVAANDQTNHLTVRYFMPWKTHPTLAVTGSQCLASCALTPGTVAYSLMKRSDNIPTHLVLHHPMGKMDVITDYSLSDNTFVHKSAGIIRTARKLAEGKVFIPSSVWDGGST